MISVWPKVIIIIILGSRPPLTGIPFCLYCIIRRLKRLLNSTFRSSICNVVHGPLFDISHSISFGRFVAIPKSCVVISEPTLPSGIVFHTFVLCNFTDEGFANIFLLMDAFSGITNVSHIRDLPFIYISVLFRNKSTNSPRILPSMHTSIEPINTQHVRL